MRFKSVLILCHSREQSSLDAAASGYETVAATETIQPADTAATAEPWHGHDAGAPRYDPGSVQCHDAGESKYAPSQSTSSSPATDTPPAPSAAINGPAAAATTTATECPSSSTPSAAATTACSSDGNAAEC